MNIIDDKCRKCCPTGKDLRKGGNSVHDKRLQNRRRTTMMTTTMIMLPGHRKGRATVRMISFLEQCVLHTAHYEIAEIGRRSVVEQSSVAEHKKSREIRGKTQKRGF